MIKYNPYTPEAIHLWHQELTKHVGWHVRHVVDYFLDKGYSQINMIDVGCCTGRLVQLMNERIEIKEAILIDAIPELIDYAKSVFGEKYLYEPCALGNIDGFTSVTVPEPHENGINLGGATSRKEGLHYRQNVPIHRFDTLWKEKYTDFIPDLIKIDAEGLDLDVLEGMQEFISYLKRKPLIVYEIAGINMSDEERCIVHDRLNFLTKMGYKPLWEDSLAPKKSCDLVMGVE